MSIIILVILVLTSFLGLVLTRNILKPVMNVAKMANNISSKNMNMRIKELEVDAEMKYLIQSFNSMIERLEKSFKHINDFSSNVAHELRTPLAIIKGEMEVLLNKNHSVKEYKKVIISALEEINRINKIIKDILLLAKLEYNQEIYKFESLNLTDFIKEIGENGKILAKEKKIKVEMTLPFVPLYINGDKIHLRRLFFNLLHNAIKFSPKNSTINIIVSNMNHTTFVDIKDTGKGISDEDLPKIFDKFYRVQQANENPDLSSGLGLNIAQTIAIAHQGIITVKSKLNEGTTFTVSLPLV